MRRTAKRVSKASDTRTGQLLRPTGESELSVAEEEMVEALLAQPRGKKPRKVTKNAAKPAAKAQAIRKKAAAKRPRAGAAKKSKSRKLPNRK
jgi:hypothetical protein